LKQRLGKRLLRGWGRKTKAVGERGRGRDREREKEQEGEREGEGVRERGIDGRAELTVQQGAVALMPTW
jgi:hypothetical protein